MKSKVLQYGRLMAPLEKQLVEAFELHRLVDQPDPKAFLAARGPEFAGLATGGFCDAALMGASLGPRAVRLAVKDAATQRRMLEIIRQAMGGVPAR